MRFGADGKEGLEDAVFLVLEGVILGVIAYQSSLSY